MVPSRQLAATLQPHANVTYRATLPHGMHCPDPEGIDFQPFHGSPNPPIPIAMMDPPSYGNYSPLTTSFDISVYGGSHETSQHGGTSAIGISYVVL